MKHPPYHLRTNKAVDRLLLVDVLRVLGADHKNYTYYSLAGPFLEDLRVMDHFFPEMKLVSLESSEQTHKRQQFNQFSSRLELRHTTLADFLNHKYEPDCNDVFWLDYTDLKYDRITEFQQVLQQVEPESVVRITLRAESDIDIGSLEDRVSEHELLQLCNDFSESFKNEFYKVFPHDSDLTKAFRDRKVFAEMILSIIKNAASEALDTAGSEVDYLPVQCTRYSDNTQMVSVTGIVCLRTEMESLREKLKSVRFANFDWLHLDKIDIPILSLKERLHLEHHLPVTDNQDAGEILYKEMDYMIEKGARRSKQQLSHYADCCRDYPNFVRISI